MVIVNQTTKHKMELAINPASFSFSCPQNFENYALLAADYPIMGSKGAMTCTLEVLIPHDEAWYRTSSETQEEQLLRLYNYKNTKAKLRLYVRGMMNMLVYITGMTVSASEGDKDLLVALDFIQRRNL